MQETPHQKSARDGHESTSLAMAPKAVIKSSLRGEPTGSESKTGTQKRVSTAEELRQKERDSKMAQQRGEKNGNPNGAKRGMMTNHPYPYDETTLF